jgi:serine/threonine-protein kinase
VPRGSAVTITVSLGPGNATVPAVTGDDRATALSKIATAGLQAVEATAHSETAPVGSVISQDPAAGASVPRGSAVTITVSLGPNKVSVPNVVGSSQAGATLALQGRGLQVTVVTAPSAEVAAGNVIAQDPVANESVPAGSRVTITVSSGP